MTRDETIKLLMMIQAAYPNYKPQDKTIAVNMWMMMLEDYTYKQVEGAFKAYVSSETKGFAPTPGQLIEKIQMITSPLELTETEAWVLVSKAIRNSGYNSVQEFGKLPEIVQKAVGAPEQLRLWGLDENYNEEVASSNFMRVYRTVLAREKEIKKMPKEVRGMIEEVNKNTTPAKLESRQNIKLLAGTGAATDEDTIPMPDWAREKMSQLKRSVADG